MGALTTKVLNAASDRDAGVSAGTDASKLAKELNGKILRIYGKYLSEDGTAVDYDGIAKSDEFSDWKALLQQLHHVSPESLPRPERMAFFINLYNALTIHGNIELGVPSNPITRSAFFSNTAYQIGSNVFSLNDIEHGVLRGNKPSPTGKSPFAANDPRNSVVVDNPDPRIHFALVCGAKSCPPIRIYTPENIEKGLQGAAENFCQSNVTVDKSKHSAELSMIFKWYSSDFGKNQSEQLDYISKFLTEEQKAELSEVRSHPKFHITWASYDWSQNSNH